MQTRWWIIPLCLTGLLLAGCDDDAHGVAGLLNMFGTTGMGPGEFSYPRAAAIRPDGSLYVVDKAGRIQCYGPAGEFRFDWRMPKYRAGKPTGLGVDAAGRIYAADTHYARITVFDAQGKLLETFGSQGEGPGQFIMPTDVAVSPDGFIYVSEYGGNDRISKFTRDWKFVLSFGGADAGADRLQRPQSLALDPDGSLWVADACNHRICRYSPEGELLQAFGSNGTAPGQLSYPYGLDLLEDGTLVVAEYGNNRVQRFARDGKSLGIWGGAGRKPGELAYPWAVEIGTGGRLYVLDSGNNRVQIVDALRDDTWRQPG